MQSYTCRQWLLICGITAISLPGMSTTVYQMQLMKCRQNIQVTANRAQPMNASRSKLRPLLSFVAMATRRVLSGCRIRSCADSIASRAPHHAPGPTRRYWYGVATPKYTATASRGSLNSRDTVTHNVVVLFDCTEVTQV